MLSWSEHFYTETFLTFDQDIANYELHTHWTTAVSPYLLCP